MSEAPKTFASALAYLAWRGVLLLTFFDAFHTLTGTTGYDWLAFGGGRFALWAPVVNGVALSGMGLFYAWLRLRRDPDPPHDLAKLERYPKAIVAYGALYLATGVLSGLAHAPTWSACLVMLTGSIALWATVDPTWQGAAASVAAAVLGTTAEIVLVKLGTFHYAESQRDLAGAVPIWLPALYLGAGPSLGSWSTRVYLPILRPRR